MERFEDLHQRRIVGSLAMFDRMIFHGYLTSLFKPGAISAFLWAQGYPMTEFTRYAQATTEEITANAKAIAICVLGSRQDSEPSRHQRADGQRDRRTRRGH